MVITNILIGKIILLSIVFGSVIAVSLIHISYLRRNYILRKGIGHQIWNTIVYSILFVAVWFFTPISTFFKDSIISFLFNEDLKNGDFFYLVFFLVIISVIPLFSGRTILQKSKYLVPLKYFTPVISTFLLYGYYRLFSNEYIFHSVFEAHEKLMIKTLDLAMFVVFIYTSMAFVYSICESKNKKHYNSLMLVDSPLLDKAGDEYERRKYYNSIIETLGTSIGKKGKALSIALVNRWGEGKTSFIGFLKNEFEKDSNTLFVEFNAWHSSNSSNLTLDFFQTLDHELSKYVYTGSVLRKYAKSLTNINSVFNPFKYLPDNWVGDKSNKEYFNDINSLLIQLGKRIVVVIDDLDRLDNKEVFAVFQVIRNSANFDNIVFITPFDKEYVANSLVEMKIHNPDDYIKKIFDVEISLPPISKFHLLKAFEDSFKGALTRINNPSVDTYSNLVSQIHLLLYDSGIALVDIAKFSLLNRLLFKTLKNKRDLNRFLNSLVVTLRESYENLYLPDVLIIELIKYLNLGFYRELFESQECFSLEAGSSNFQKTYKLNAPKIDEILNSSLADEDLRELFKSLLEQLVEEPLSNDFNSEYSFHYTANYTNYHQFNYTGISKTDIDELFKANEKGDSN